MGIFAVGKEIKPVESGYYFVDYESIHQAGLNGIDKLSENDKVIIFYTPSNETLTFAMYKKMIRCKADIELHRVQNGGKDALNFQLCTFLGYIIGDSSETKCYIISDNANYEHIVNFWQTKNIEVKISPNIMKTFQQQTAAAVSEPAETSLDKAVKSLNLSSEDKAFLYNLIDNAYKEYPGEKEYCRNYVWSKMKGHNKNSVFKVIKPYI